MIPVNLPCIAFIKVEVCVLYSVVVFVLDSKALSDVICTCLPKTHDLPKIPTAKVHIIYIVDAFILRNECCITQVVGNYGSCPCVVLEFKSLPSVLWIHPCISTFLGDLHSQQSNRQALLYFFICRTEV